MTYYPRTPSSPGPRVAYTPVPTRSTAAIVALILAILSFTCFGPLTAIPAIIVGAIAIRAINRDELSGKGLAVTGLILGIINTVLSILVLVLVVPFIFLPAFERARMLANRTADAANVHGLARAVEAYSVENDGRFPPHLAATFIYATNPKVYVSPASGTKPLTTLPTGPWTDFAADLEDHCDYVYIGADLRQNRLRNPASIIVIYTKDIHPDHGRNLAYADGHVDWTPESRLAAAFDASNRERARMGLPPVPLDGPPPIAPTAAAAPARPPVPAPVPAPPAPGPEAVAPPVPAPPTPPRVPRVERVRPPRPSAFASGADALAALKEDDPIRQRLAMSYLSRTAPTDADADARKEIAPLLNAQLEDPTKRGPALHALRRWATRDSTASLTRFLEATKPDDIHTSGDVSSALEALGAAGDPKSAPLIAKYLFYGFNRSGAKAGLIAMGSEAESAVWPYLTHKDFITAQTACDVLAKIGTDKSLPALRQALTTKTPFVKDRIQTTINAIETRKTP